MRIAALSDLHCEFEKPKPKADGHPNRGPSLYDLKMLRPDVMVLAGDIEVSPRMVLDYVAQVARFLGSIVVYVPGNHEYYKGDITWDTAELRKGFTDLRSNGTEAYLLNETSVVISGVRFLGATLWTDYALFGPGMIATSRAMARMKLNDHKLIAIDGKPFRPEDAHAMHVRTRSWLNEILRKQHSGPTVVVTHHAPAKGSIAPKYAEDPLTAAYASDLSSIIEEHRPELWLHGHTHDSFDYFVGKTRVVCNPRGYPSKNGQQENAFFRPDLILSV